MTNPTSNYSWQMPTATDLVTDLPADFEVFGQAVDTRLKALQPGTTLGDLAYSSATANTNTRLAIGTNGQVLSVSGGVPAWANQSSGGMTLLSTTTLSGSSTVISSISQDYLQLYIEIIGAYNSAATDFRIRFNGDTATNYNYGINGGVNAGAETRDVNAGAFIDLGYLTNLADQAYRTSGSIYLTNYVSTGTKQGSGNLMGVASGSVNHWFGTFKYIGASAISSITFFPTSGTFTDGTVKIYGVK
jgi:hypothetical protein